MKKVLSLVLALVLVFALTSMANAELVLKLSEVHAEDYPTGLADQEFARLVEEKTEGRVKVDCHFNGTLYDKEAAAIEALQDGEIGFARVSASPVGTFVPEINALILPYLYKNGEHMWAVLNGDIGQTILKNIEASGQGLVGLCYYDAGSRCFYCTKKFTTVAEMAGLKFRMQDNPMMLDMVAALGAQGVAGIGSNEVYNAIKTGVVDGAENNYPTYQNMGDYEAAPYYILDQHTRVPEILLASAEAKEQVGEADWALIMECAAATQQYEIDEWAKKEESSKKIVVDGGSTIVELTSDAFAEFQAAMAPLYEKYGADYTDIIDQIKAIGENY